MKNPRGQSLVEFALVVPILLLLVLGTLEFGMALHNKIVLTNAAREGANYISFRPDEDDNAKQAVINEGALSELTINPADVTINPGAVADRHRGDTITVTVTRQYNLMIFGFMFGNIPLSGEAKMLIQYEP